MEAEDENEIITMATAIAGKKRRTAWERKKTQSISIHNK
jgi:hypothetical protein